MKALAAALNDPRLLPATSKAYSTMWTPERSRY
jgi:hypothetical protein